MTTLSDLSFHDVQHRLEDGIRLHIGPFVGAIRSRGPSVARSLTEHYPDYPVVEGDAFVDFRVSVERDAGIGSRLRGRGLIRVDDGLRFPDFAYEDALPYLEWSINWCVATRANFFLMLHAGSVTRDGCAMLMPGLPGSGKSTLCAYLMHHGWRLLSDEFTIIDTNSRRVVPFPRLIPLKNESIATIRTAVPEAKVGPSFEGTRKGTVAHVCPPPDQIHAAQITAEPRLVVFPQFKADSPTELVPVSAPETFVEITKNAFNDILFGRTGFELCTDLVDKTSAYRLTYSDLADAGRVLDDLADQHFDQG